LTTHNLTSKVAGVLAIIGGFLIIASGFAVHGFLLLILDFLKGKVTSYLPGLAGALTSLAIQILTVLITFGGITVIVGGIAVLSGRIFTGRLLITLGGGAGFLGLLITIAYSTVSLGPSSIISHSEYWIGVILAVVARWLAKRR
jgi:hypothetical protein